MASTETRLPEMIEKRAAEKPHQCGVVCWRFDEAGDVSVLLITSRRTGRWVIPKGNLKKRETRHECARREAYEEAGVMGKVGKKAIGRYVYFKPELQQWVTVAVYTLHVSKEAEQFPEVDIRQRRWLPAQEAATYLEEPDLRALCATLSQSGRLPTSKANHTSY